MMSKYILHCLLCPSQEMCTVEEPNEEFTSRHSLEWKFLFLDHRYSLHFNVFCFHFVKIDVVLCCLCSMFLCCQWIIC